jgi:predicted transcriptional regulator
MEDQSTMSDSDHFYNLLFEASNENRHNILLLLQDMELRITDLSRELALNNPETRRHVSRLEEIKLITRDKAGFYTLTPYGEVSLILFRELKFLSSNNEYFSRHQLSNLPQEFIRSIGDLVELKPLSNPMDYLRHVENLIKESSSFIWLLVDQFPIHSISAIVNAIDRDIKIKIIETKERVLNPDFEVLSSEESDALGRTRHTPLTEQRMVDRVNINLFVTDKRCVLALPIKDGEFDYTGFTGTDNMALEWCRGLFQYYWDKSEERKPSAIIEIVTSSVKHHQALQKITVLGTNNSEIDAKIVQDAVDNFNEVLLKGEFNFGSNKVTINKSVKIKGEINNDNSPSTIIYKKGWTFPFNHYDSVFMINGEEADISIENISFTDFNHTCIWIKKGRDVTIRNNSMTLISGFGRGMTYGAFGDAVIGIWVQDSDTDFFSGDLLIEDNYIDFARGGAYGGFLTRGGIEQDPEHRPDLVNHEYFMSFGLGLHRVSGQIFIHNNIIRNINARGIATTDNLETARILIKCNTIESDIFGSYPFYAPEAGAGILVQSAWGFPSPGFHVEILNNSITFDRVNYSGIKVLGPTMDRKGADKLSNGIISGNHIHLAKGYEGVHVRRCDNFDVSNNQISGKAYYGFRVSGRKNDTQDLRALKNRIEDNDMDKLDIMDPDEYSDNHADGNMFQKGSDGSNTCHVWLGKNTCSNVVTISEHESVIDEGEENKTTRARI